MLKSDKNYLTKIARVNDGMRFLNKDDDDCGCIKGLFFRSLGLERQSVAEIMYQMGKYDSQNETHWFRQNNLSLANLLDRYEEKLMNDVGIDSIVGLRFDQDRANSIFKDFIAELEEHQLVDFVNQPKADVKTACLV